VGGALLLGLMAVVFIAWAGTMFVMLFQIRQIGTGLRYGTQPGLRATFSAYRAFLTQPEWRRRRWLLLGLTVVLVGMVFVMARGMVN
jgi:hypothetical protein